MQSVVCLFRNSNLCSLGLSLPSPGSSASLTQCVFSITRPQIAPFFSTQNLLQTGVSICICYHMNNIQRGGGVWKRGNREREVPGKDWWVHNEVVVFISSCVAFLVWSFILGSDYGHLWLTLWAQSFLGIKGALSSKRLSSPLGIALQFSLESLLSFSRDAILLSYLHLLDVSVCQIFSNHARKNNVSLKTNALCNQNTLDIWKINPLRVHSLNTSIYVLTRTDQIWLNPFFFGKLWVTKKHLKHFNRFESKQSCQEAGFFQLLALI